RAPGYARPGKQKGRPPRGGRPWEAFGRTTRLRRRGGDDGLHLREDDRDLRLDAGQNRAGGDGDEAGKQGVLDHVLAFLVLQQTNDELLNLGHVGSSLLSPLSGSLLVRFGRRPGYFLAYARRTHSSLRLRPDSTTSSSL